MPRTAAAKHLDCPYSMKILPASRGVDDSVGVNPDFGLREVDSKAPGEGLYVDKRPGCETHQNVPETLRFGFVVLCTMHFETRSAQD